jgi:hypothetical protein
MEQITRLEMQPLVAGERALSTISLCDLPSRENLNEYDV